MDSSAVTTDPGRDTPEEAQEDPRPPVAASMRDRQRGRERRVLTGLVALLLGAIGTGLAVGAVGISPGQVLAILAEPVGLSLPWAYETRQALVLTAIRLPRVLLGVGVGGGLAVSGAIMQGLFRNPLADPSLIGVSSGAALAAVVTIVLGSTLFGAWADALGAVLLPAAAFAGGVAAYSPSCTTSISRPSLPTMSS